MDSDEPPVVVVGGGIAGVTFAETFATLCPTIKVELISATALLKVASNLVQSGTALEEFDVTEQHFTQFADAHKSVSVTLDRVVALNASGHELQLSSGSRKRYSKLVICSGARPHLITGSADYVIGIRDTESVKDLRRRLADARRVIVVGNGGIATELMYELDKCEVIWVIKDKSIGSTFFDAAAAQFFTSKLDQTRDRSDVYQPSKRLKYVVDESGTSGDELGSALGPDWVSKLNLEGSKSGDKKVKVEYDVEVVTVYNKIELPEEKQTRLCEEFDHESAIDWPAFVELTNGKVYGCDFIVSATGVSPNSELFADGNKLDLAEDLGICVNNRMETSEADVYAAGDVCFANWPHAHHWIQMRLWTQARQMGAYAAYCLASTFIDLDPLFHFNFEVFAHVTKFFGYKVILLGLFNGQKMGNKYEVLYRITDNAEYVKVLLKDGFMRGAVLIGETDLEETFEHLIHNQLDLTRYGEDLLNPTVDIEDYFD